MVERKIGMGNGPHPAAGVGWLLLLSLLLLGVATTSLAEQKRFDGVEIVVAVQDASAIGAPAEAHARSWEARTGGRVRVERIPFIDLFNRQMDSLHAEQGAYDVLLHASGWTADFFPYLSEMPTTLRESEAFDDIHPTYREHLMTWDGKWIAMTVDGDLFSGYYRKDLFADPANQTAFRAQYGYELGPPQTWDQYRDIAQFFTGRQAADGTELYGAAEAFARGGQQFWDLFSRASAYTNHPDFPGAQFFDPDTMGAQIDNPGWVRATEEYAEILRYSPPAAADFSIVEARQAFLDGHSAMILDWGDTGQLANADENSRVKGEVGYFLLPGSHAVWNAHEWRWDEYEQPHRAPFLAFGGWVASVPRNSRQQEAAWDFIQWYSSPENSLRDVVTAGTGINPYRLSHFTHIDAWTNAFSLSAASEYLGVIQTSLDSPHAALDLRLPGFHRYTEALEEALTRVLAGEAQAQAALTEVANAWEAITDELGRERQLHIYRTAMGLSGEPQRPRPGGGVGKERLQIGFSQATTTEPWRLLFNQELRKEGVLHPEVELIERDAQDQVANQIAHVEEFIQAGVDAILISPKVAEPLTPVVTRAFNAGIPVFVLDRDLANDRYTQFIGGDNLTIGRAAGRYAVAHLGGAGQARGKVVEIWGGRGSTPAWERHRGFTEVIEGEPGIVVVNPPSDGDWKQDRGYEIMVEALAAHPAIDLVYAHNDPMAFGAYLAAKEAGRENGIAFLGIDGIPAEGVRWVDQGVLTATFLYKTPGDEGLRQALRFLRGEEVARRFTLDTRTIDHTNAAAILEEAGVK